MSRTASSSNGYAPEAPGAGEPIDRRAEGAAPAMAFAALASDLAAASGLDQVLGTALQFAVTTMDCDWATIKLGPTRRYATITATSGPPVAQAGGAQAIRAGSVHVVELAAAGTTLGALAFYATHSKGFSATDTTTARVLAVHTALAVVAVRNAVDLSEAIAMRAMIAQAQGIVMERYRVSSEDAFTLLRRCSQDNNLKLRDLAREVAVSRRLPNSRSRRASTGRGRV